MISKMKSVSDWSKTALNKKITDSIVNIMKIIISNVFQNNVNIDINGLLEHFITIIKQYFTINFDFVQRYFALFFSNSSLDDKSEIFVDISENIWQDIEQCFYDIIMDMTIFYEQRLQILVKSILLMIRRMSLYRHPNICTLLLTLDHITRNYELSLEIAGYMSAIINYVIIISGPDFMQCIVNYCITMSNTRLFKLWIDNRKSVSLIKEINRCMDIEGNGRIEILEMWSHLYVMLEELEDISEQPLFVSWLQNLTTCVKDELTFIETRAKYISYDRCIPDQMFFQIAIKLLLRNEDNVHHNHKPKQLKTLSLVERLIDNIVKESNTVQMIWLKMLEVGLENDQFVDQCRDQDIISRIICAIDNCLRNVDICPSVFSQCLTIVTNLMPILDTKTNCDNLPDLFQIIYTFLFRDFHIYPLMHNETISTLLCIVNTGCLHTLPLNIWPQLLTMNPTENSLTLIYSIILQVGTCTPFRLMIPIDVCIKLLSWFLSCSSLSTISFHSLCSFICVVISRKSFKSNNYQRIAIHHIPDGFISTKLSLKRLLQLSMLKDWPNLQMNKSVHSFITILQFNESTINLLVKFLDMICLLEELSDITIFVIYILNSLYSHDIPSWKNYIDLYNKSLVYIRNNNNCKSSLIRGGFRYIDWKCMILISSLYPELKEEILQTMTIIEQKYCNDILFFISDNVGLYLNSYEIHDYIFISLSLLQRSEESCRKLDEFIQNILNGLNPNLTDHINLLITLLSLIKLYSIQLNCPEMSQLLMFVRQAHKSFKKNLPMSLKLITISTNIIKIIHTFDIDLDNRRKFIDFFHDLFGIVHRIVGKSFQESYKLLWKLAEQMAILFCYYWNSINGRDEECERRIEDICLKIFTICITKNSFVSRLAGYIFVNGIITTYGNSNTDNRDLVKHLLSMYHQQSLQLPDIEIVPNTVMGDLFALDDVQSRMGSFLQTWISISKLLPIDISDLGSLLLPFINKNITNHSTKPRTLCKFITLLYQIQDKRDMKIVMFVEKIMSTFIMEWKQLLIQCNQQVILPGNVTYRQLVNENLGEVLWKVGSCRNNEERNNMISIFFSDQISFEEYNLLSANVHLLIGRVVIKQSASIDCESCSLVCEYILSHLTIRDIRTIVNDKIYSIYWEILSFLTSRSIEYQHWHSSVLILHRDYLNSTTNFDQWLCEKPQRLMELAMFIISKMSSENKDKSCQIWCYFTKVILQCHTYWIEDTNVTNKDAMISFLIVRHLRHMEYYLNDQTADLLCTVLRDLVFLADNIITDSSRDIHRFWYQQIFYFISNIWPQLLSNSFILNEIFVRLVALPRWNDCLELIDILTLTIPGFCDLIAIDSLLTKYKDIDTVQLIDNLSKGFHKYGFSILQYRKKSLLKLSGKLFDLSKTEITNNVVGNNLQQLNDIFHLCLEYSQMVEMPIKLEKDFIDAVIHCLKYLKLLLPRIPVGMDIQLTSVSLHSKNLVTHSQISLINQLLNHCLYDFGNNSWLCFRSLCNCHKLADISSNNYLLDMLTLFSDNNSTDIYHSNTNFHLILDHLESSTPIELYQWCGELSKMLCFHSSEIIYSHCHSDILCIPSITYEFLPIIFASAQFSGEENNALVKGINKILREGHYNERKIILMKCIIKRLEYTDNGNVQTNLEGIDLILVAKIAYGAKMYTTSLIALEKLWLNDNFQLSQSVEIVELYEKCFKGLASQEELLADTFILNSSKEEIRNHSSWLFEQGQFDLLRQLVSLQTDQSTELLTLKNVEMIDLLWKLSRWGDEEKFEINSLISDNASTLTMYDFLYSRSSHICDAYRDSVRDLCKFSYDQEECVRPLIEYATLTSSLCNLPSILDSLFRMANKFNIGQLDSSITFTLVCSNKSNNNVKAISNYSLAVSDLANRCQRPQYVDLILDMFHSHKIDKTILKCDDESAFMRMIALINGWRLGEMKKSFVQLEQLILDCQKHLLSCKSGNHKLLQQLFCNAISKLCLWNQQYPVHSVPHIRTQILDPAITIFSETPDCNLLETMSTFSYQQYTFIDQYMHSAEYDSRVKILSESRRDIEHLGNLGDNSRLRRALERQSKFDENDLSTLNEDRNQFLLSAVLSCAKCLQMDDKHNFQVFRLISMWLNNVTLDEVNDVMKLVVTDVASHKFLVLIPQLCARLNTDNNKAFENNLETLIERIIVDHPYHSIYNLLAIRNAKQDLEYSDSKSLQIKSSTRNDKDKMDNRISVAKKMINKLLRSSRSSIVRDADLLTTAYIEWANTDVSRYRSELQKKIKMPSSCPLINIGKKINLPVPTITIPIDKSLLYPSHRLVKIIGFDNIFSLQGGINLPKVIWCQSSDGIKRRQLVKSKDDLRQDSVMQQVFSVVNSFFGNNNFDIAGTVASLIGDESNDVTFNKMNYIRTYKVIPTSQTSGIIEWCEDTIPLGDWLCDDKSGAHIRYRPQDLTPHQCRVRLHLVQDKGLNERIKTFKEVYDKIKPVFGYFLLENFVDPRAWFKARKSYTQSVAINSMIGFILGLGDRHVQNILLDLNSAELIHIDLGIAFDQGRLLPTPEVVPFRLTRDLVHAMGPFGVEGRFKTTCCNVLNVLRSHKDIILTLIEVLLHDPLNMWTLTPQQARLLQAKRVVVLDSPQVINKTMIHCERFERSNICHDQNQMAERVILELSRKLCGAIDNSHLNVEGHVNYLIQRATDVDNLSRMFSGWQAYL